MGERRSVYRATTKPKNSKLVGKTPILSKFFYQIIVLTE
jgi:hypothetical protein